MIRQILRTTCGVLIVILVIFFVWMNKEKTNTSFPEDMYPIFTDKYEEKAKDFTLSLEESAHAAVAFQKKSYEEASPEERGDLGLASPSVHLGVHLYIKGDHYVFSVRRKEGLSLRGLYVNGYTGEVSVVGIDPDPIRPNRTYSIPKNLRLEQERNQQKILREIIDAKRYPLREVNTEREENDENGKR